MAVELIKPSKFIHSSEFDTKIKHKKQSNDLELKRHNVSFAWIYTAVILIAFMVGVYVDDVSLPDLNKIKMNVKNQMETVDLVQCYKTCSLSVVESVPQNLTSLKHPLPSTFDAWHYLISNAKYSIDLAAYKSSLRGKNVLGSITQDYSAEGDQIFNDLENAGLNRSLKIRIVENGVSKDKGDNADGVVLFERGAVDRRTLNLQQIYDSGIMHSKFIVSDNRNFYVGSANLDWRSLNQKYEMGVLVKDCPCLAKELTTVFDFYWQLSEAKNKEQFENMVSSAPSLSFNMNQPLRIQYKNVDTEVYIATSPKPTHSQQTWDLDAIVHTIESAQNYLYIHVMDIFPVFLYSPNKEFWPIIDNSIRDAVLRGVHVKIISAALHYPRIGLTFLKSLELINEVSKKGSIDIKILKVPSPKMISLLKRERRTHKKIVVSDESVIIGNSNWSGDYFESVGTGTAIVIKQKRNSPSQNFIDEMRQVFDRDFDSPYAYTLDHYYNECIVNSKPADFCETEKDVSFLTTPPAASSNL